MTELIWEKLNTVTADAQNAAIAKAKELNFDLNKGLITIDESLINLNDDIATLRDAIQKEKLQQLPLSLQKSLLDNIEKISKFLVSLAAGTNETVNLVDTIEVLHTDIWRLGLQMLSDEYLGYQTKLNQIKNLELELGKLKESLEQGVTTKSELETILASAKKTDVDLTGQLDALKLSVKKVTEDSEKIQTSEQKAAASLKIVQTNQETIAGQLSSTTTSSGEISALEEKIKLFYKNIDDYRTSIDTTTTTANASVKKNTDEADNLVGRLKKLEDEIKKQLQQATGYGLFGTFQTRQIALAKSKWYWAGAVILLILVSIVVTLVVAFTTKDFHEIAFYIKLSLSIPLVFAIGFCAVQYSTERRLEEEYAIRSNISYSLIPYQELVEKLVSKDDKEEKAKYNAFVIESITKVFTSPTDKVFHSGEKSNKSFKEMTKVIQSILKAAKH
jgi:hypothetical protein